ncbi:GON-4-like protein [Ciona intestinalis]
MNNSEASTSKQTGDPKEQEKPPDTESSFNDLKFDEQLEAKLKKHGLNRRNVKTIIHELLNDDNVRQILKSSLTGDAESKEEPRLQLPELKNLRPRTKSNAEKSKKTDLHDLFPKFTDIPFPDNDDEDDDFVPDFNDLISLDMEESASQSYSEMDLNSSIEGTTADYDGFFKTTTVAQTTTPTSKDVVVMTTPPHRNSISLLRELDSEMQEIDEKSRMRQTETEEEIIARRTRSKLPLHNVGLEELETAFDPPDAGDDMCIQSSDEDWLKFLAEVFTQDPGEKTTDLDDDVEQDPDYNFMASEAEETHEKDDYRDDQGVCVCVCVCVRMCVYVCVCVCV